MDRGLVALAALAAVLLAASPARAEEDVAFELRLSPDVRFSNATLFAGAFAFAPAQVANVGAVDARALELPPGTLHVCPREGETSGSAPPIQGFNVPCRNAVTHENPVVRFGERTALALAGDFAIVRFPNASLGFLAAEATPGPTWGAVASEDGITLSTREGNLTFRALGRSARTVVESDGETTWYNGTAFTFLFQGDAAFTLRAGAFHGLVAERLDVALHEADEIALRDALRPRALLDLEEAIEGADAREPVANVTALLASVERVPRFLNGAILGHLEGSVGGATLTGDAITFLRVPRFEGRFESGALAGTGDVAFTVHAQGFAPAGEDPRKPPFVLALALWAVALAAHVVFRWRDEDRRSRLAGAWAGRALVLLAFLAFDFVVKRTLGASAGSLLLDGAPRGSVVALAVFEVASFTLAWLLLALPLRLALARALAKVAPRVAPWASVASAAALLAFAFAAPYSMLALGILVARL